MNFSTGPKKQIRNKIEKITFADVDLCYLSCYIFKKNHGLIEEDNPSEQVVIVEEELNRVDIDERLET